VVDDEEMIRTVARNILEDFGHEVLEACDGQEAVDLFNEGGSTIDAVLLDMTMPNLDGAETLRMLRHVEPRVRVLLSSGYSEQEALRLMSSYDGVGFLKKPYLPKELIGKLQEFLDG
jgi:CheY-like chemotaxis protein